MDNSTNTTSLAEPTERGFECIEFLQTTVFAFYCSALLINVIHLFILMNLKSLKGVPYHAVLINLTLSDIAISGSMVVFYGCLPYFAFINLFGEPEERIVLNSVINAANYIGYYVFAIGSVEKYKAMCQPLTYHTSKYINRLPLTFGAAWVTVAVVTIAKAFLEVKVQSVYIQTPWFSVIFMLIFALTPSLLSAGILVRVYNELRKMQNRSETAGQDRQTKRATTYFITIFILFMIALLINSIALVVAYSTGSYLVMRFYHIFKSFYTVSNTFIYGWRSKSYRRYLRQMVGCRRDPSVRYTN